MKLAVVGVVALPLVLGGFGIAAAAMFVPDPAPVTEQITVSTDGTTSDVSGLGTSIDGRRPHLTVIDGGTSIILPGSLAGIVSMLPRALTALSRDAPTLIVPDTDRAGADGPDGDGETPPLLTPAPPRYAPQPAPAPSAGPVYPAPAQAPAPVPVVPSTQAAPESPSAPAIDPGNDEGYSRDRHADRHDRHHDWDLVRGIEGSPVPPPDATIMDAEKPRRTGPPAHASRTGRSDHADTTGAPPHANVHARTDTIPSPR